MEVWKIEVKINQIYISRALKKLSTDNYVWDCFPDIPRDLF